MLRSWAMSWWQACGARPPPLMVPMLAVPTKPTCTGLLDFGDRRYDLDQARAADFFEMVRCGGHCLWYHVLPSLIWFPFLRMRSLHFGHVPIDGEFSFA